MTGDINPFQPGIGLLARHTEHQVLPVRIVGIRAVLPKGGRRPHRTPRGGPHRRADPRPTRRGRAGLHRPFGGDRPGALIGRW